MLDTSVSMQSQISIAEAFLFQCFASVLTLVLIRSEYPIWLDEVATL